MQPLTVTVDVFEVEFRAWSIAILCNNGLLLEANEQNYYAVVIVKIIAGCTENQGSWPWTNWQLSMYISSAKCMEISNVQ